LGALGIQSPRIETACEEGIDELLASREDSEYRISFEHQEQN